MSQLIDALSQVIRHRLGELDLAARPWLPRTRESSGISGPVRRKLEDIWKALSGTAKRSEMPG